MNEVVVVRDIFCDISSKDLESPLARKVLDGELCIENEDVI